MPSEIITVVLSLVAIASATVSAFVSLYVKSAIGPIVVRLQEHENCLNERHRDCIELWKEIRQISENVARIEGRSTKGE